MENLINPIKTEIDTWNQVRTTNIALNFLTSGNGFIIQKVDYLEWKRHHPTSIHCYFATEQLQLKFFVIDDVSDKRKHFKVNTNLLEKEFSRTITNHGLMGTKNSFIPLKYTINPRLNPQDAKNRIIDWDLSAELWFESLTDKEIDVPRLVIIPFSDLKTFFSSSDDDVFVFFALKKYDQTEYNGYNIEFILTQIHPQGKGQLVANSSNENEVFADVTRPSPPFDQDKDFNLLT